MGNGIGVAAGGHVQPLGGRDHLQLSHQRLREGLRQSPGQAGTLQLRFFKVRGTKAMGFSLWGFFKPRRTHDVKPPRIDDTRSPVRAQLF